MDNFSSDLTLAEEDMSWVEEILKGNFTDHEMLDVNLDDLTDDKDLKEDDFAKLYASQSSSKSLAKSCSKDEEFLKDGLKENGSPNDFTAFTARTEFLSNGFDDIIHSISNGSSGHSHVSGETSFTPQEQVDGESPRTYQHPESGEYEELLASTAARILKVAQICGVTVSLFAMSRMLKVRCLAFTDYRPKWMLLLHTFLRHLTRKERRHYLFRTDFEKDMTMVLKQEVHDLTTDFFSDDDDDDDCPSSPSSSDTSSQTSTLKRRASFVKQHFDPYIKIPRCN